MGHKKTKIKKTPARATVQLVRHGEEHPYVIEVMTPGWRGCDYLSARKIQRTMPEDLRRICDVLKKANVKCWTVSEPIREGMLFSADGSTEFVLKTFEDFQAAALALQQAGWLQPISLEDWPTNSKFIH